MTRFFQFTFLVLCTAFVGTLAFIEVNFPHIRLNEQQIQDNLANSFNAVAENLAPTYDLSNSEVNFLPGGIISVNARISYDVENNKQNVEVKLQTNPVYLPDAGVIVLHDATVTRLVWQGASSQEAKELTSANHVIGRAKIDAAAKSDKDLNDIKRKLKGELEFQIERYFAKTPIYRLDKQGWIWQFVSLKVTEIRFDKKDLLIWLAWAPNNVRLPVYLIVAIILGVPICFACVPRQGERRQ